MIAPRGSVFAVHALLDDCPFLVFRHDERVMVKLVASLDGGVVHFRGHLARICELFNEAC